MRIRQEAAWQGRIEALLESLEDIERARVADELRTLLAQQTFHRSVSAARAVWPWAGTCVSGPTTGASRPAWFRGM